MERLNRELNYKWHVALNHYNNVGKDFRSWMYDAKHMADEIARIAIWFMCERTGQLPVIHRQCSQSQPVPIPENHLSCCLGQKCKECPHLLALEKAEVTLEQLDEMKAWTCTAHILFEKTQRSIDDSEGYIMHEGDKMYWENVYSNLDGEDRDD